MATKKDIAKKMVVGHQDFKHDGKVFSLPIYKGKKGKGSLNRASGKNEGDNMSLGRKGNEEARA